MAQTGFTPIQIYSSSTPTNAPSAGNLTNNTKGSELAVNIADKNLFFKDSTNAVNTVPIRQSGAASDGWLSATDWNTFNNKQPAGTYVTSVTGTAPVVSSGGTTPAISMAAATTSVSGYLTSTDWNTFNGKQAALVSGSNIKTVGGVSLLGSGDAGTIGVGYGGTGTGTAFVAGSVIFAGASGVYSQDNGQLFWDNPNDRLGIGTSTPAQKLDVNGVGRFGELATKILVGINGDSISSDADMYVQTSTSNFISLRTNFTEAIRLETNQNVKITNGNVVIATSGKGIDFSATPGTGTSELLADYEEGTWTPTIVGSTLAGVGTYSSQVGIYTKVGNLVTVSATLVWSAHTGTGNMSLSGLPFTSVASYNPISACFVNNLTITGQAYAAVNAGGTAATLYSVNNGTSALLAMDAAASMFFTFSYYA